MAVRGRSLPRRNGPAGPDADRWQRAQRAGRRWAAWGAALGVLVGAVLQAPAQWLADGLHQASDGRLMLAEARGSLWNGSAVLVLTGGAGSHDAMALPDRLQWQLRPGLAGLHLRATQACCLNGTLRLRLQPAWGGYTLWLGDAAGPADGGPAAPATRPAAAAAATAAATAHTSALGQWPAGWLAGLGTPWNTLQLGGQLQLAASGLQLQSVAGRLQLQGSLVLTLRDVSSRLSSLPVLGSYQLQVLGPGGNGEPTRVRLSTQDGALRLTGDGQWTGPRLRFRGQAQAGEGHESALTNLLNIIGRRQGALSVISIG